MTDTFTIVYFSALALVCGFGVSMVVVAIVHPEKFPSLWEDKE